ncbi:BglG family transcription antiterminator [Acidipropionibacterium jensenii]|uniref:BglG family transcription antiterminator n=1 Tax=Acidipropionibacterium jensenii TaxID=1749 RepID=UPI00214B95D9|nr:PRD domain-containing protein [Acidipropionibacterium jensenii]
MNREAAILRQLEITLTVTPADLAERFSLGRRSIANAVARLDDLLGTSAAIRLEEGRYRLYIVDAHRYGAIRDRLLAADDSLNDPEHRCAIIYRELLSSASPVRVEDLARTMSVSQTTAATDLTHLRSRLTAHLVTIEGSPNSGVHLAGEELNLRMAGLTHFAKVLCDDDPLDGGTAEAAHRICTEDHLSREATRTVLRWLTMSINRCRSGHVIESLPSEFSQLEGTPADDFAACLLSAVCPTAGLSLPLAERRFLAMSVAGMRTPDDPVGRQLFPADDEMPDLVDAIFTRISLQMGLHVSASELTDEFAHHLSFMLSRMRFRISVDAAAVADIRGQYPVAYRMAEISRDVLQERTGLAISDSEVGLMAGYHQVFLDAYERQQRTHLRVAVVTSTGRVSGHLLRIQVSKVLPEGTKFLMLSADRVDDSALAGVDLVISTPAAMSSAPPAVNCANSRPPVIELGQVFDEAELVKQLSRIRFRRQADLQLAGAGPSLLVSMLDPDRFLALPAGTDYWQATTVLVDRLESLGLVDSTFGGALAEREKDATMVLNDQVGFPHATIPGADQVAFAMAVIPHSPHEQGVRAVFVMGVPDKRDYDDTILIAVYDEIIRLASAPSLLTAMSRLTSHEQLFWFMANHPTGSHQ